MLGFYLASCFLMMECSGAQVWKASKASALKEGIRECPKFPYMPECSHIQTRYCTRHFSQAMQLTSRVNVGCQGLWQAREPRTKCMLLKCAHGPQIGHCCSNPSPTGAHPTVPLLETDSIPLLKAFLYLPSLFVVTLSMLSSWHPTIASDLAISLFSPNLKKKT